MPQTRFVLSKALALGLKPILVINKVDKENCRPDEVHEDVFDLMFNLARKKGAAILLITHDRSLASKADRMLTMNHGQLSETIREAVPA